MNAVLLSLLTLLLSGCCVAELFSSTFLSAPVNMPVVVMTDIMLINTVMPKECDIDDYQIVDHKGNVLGVIHPGDTFIVGLPMYVQQLSFAGKHHKPWKVMVEYRTLEQRVDNVYRIDLIIPCDSLKRIAVD